MLSKIYERGILHQIKVTIEENHLYRATQSGYRQGHSCITLLHKLHNDITSAMKRSEITIAVMADYSKAFDTVDFETMLNKLKALNFSNDFIKLIAKYLTDRFQFVQFDDKKSPLLRVVYGVQQGSILGPILFNL